MKKSWIVGAAIAATLSSSASAVAATVYDATPATVPPNVASLGFEATATTQFGGLLRLDGNGAAPVVSVLMSSGACERGRDETCETTPGAVFRLPVTLTALTRGEGNAPGRVLATQTKTFAIPYRPSADPVCGADGGWSPDGGATCLNGVASELTFDPLDVTLPDTPILTVSFDTTHYGRAPIGESAPCYATAAGCGYDMLGVGLVGGPHVGSQPLPDGAYLASPVAANYCDGGDGGVGTLRLDASCWTEFQPAIRVAAARTSSVTMSHATLRRARIVSARLDDGRTLVVTVACTGRTVDCFGAVRVADRGRTVASRSFHGRAGKVTRLRVSLPARSANPPVRGRLTVSLRVANVR